MKAYRGARGIAPLILEIGPRRHRTTSPPGHCTPGKEFRYRFNSRLGGPQRWSGH